MTRSCRLRFGLAVSWKSLHGNSAGDDITVWHVLWIDNFREKAQRRDGKASVWGESTGGKKQWDRFTVQHVLHRDAWNEHATHATTHPDAIYLPADGSMCVCVWWAGAFCMSVCMLVSSDLWRLLRHGPHVPVKADETIYNTTIQLAILSKL